MEPGQRTRNFAFNSIAAVINQIVVMICGFITPRVMLVCYGSELNGLVSSINQFLAYFTLVEAGLASATVYALYKPLAHKDYDGINGIVSAARKFYFQAGYIFSFLLLILVIIYPIFVSASSLAFSQVMLLIFVLGMRGCLDLFAIANFRVLLTADQKLYVVSLLTSFCTVLNTAMVYYLAHQHFNIVTVYSFALISVLIRPVVLWIYFKKKYPFLNYSHKPFLEALDKRWDAFYLQILQAVQAGTPIVLATFFVSLKMVSVYSIFNIVLSGVGGIVNIFVSGLSASFGDVIAKKEIEVLQKSSQDFEYAFYAIIAVIYSVCFLTLMPFIKIFTRGVVDINYDLPILGGLMVLNSYLYSVKTPQGMLVISAGLYRETRFQNTVQAAILIVGGTVFASKWGLYGIVAASCLSNLYRVIDLLFFVPGHVTGLPVKNTAYRIFWSVMTIAVIVSGITYRKELHASNWLQWVELAVVVTSLAAIATILSSLAFQRQQMLSVIRRIRGILRL